MATIQTPRPPLNLFDRVRLNLSSSWQTIYEAPEYEIPADGPNPARTIEAVALLTSLVVTNTDTDTVEVSLRIDDGTGTTYAVVDDLPVPAYDFALIEFGKQNMPSGDKMQIKLNTGQSGVAHLSFILNQREEFTVL